MKYDLETTKIGQPAHRALKNAGIETLEQLSQFSERELLNLHGFGPKALDVLKNVLAEQGRSLKKEDETRK